MQAKTFKLVLVLGLTLGLNMQAFAKLGNSEGWEGYHQNGCMKKLNLTTEQQNQIKTIRTDMQKEMQKEMHSKNEMQAGVSTLLNEPTFNEEKARALIKDSNSKHDEMKLTMLKMRHQINQQVLTEAQRATLNTCQMDMMQNKSGHRKNDQRKNGNQHGGNHQNGNQNSNQHGNHHN